MRKIIACVALAISPMLGAEPLLQSSTSWDGGDIAYPEGEAEITSIILRIEEGAEPPFHCHPVPTMGYVLKGSLEVETSKGQKVLLTQGQSVVEVMRTVHRGLAVDAPAEIVVFYAGAAGVPVTVLPENDPDNAYCQH